MLRGSWGREGGGGVVYVQNVHQWKTKKMWKKNNISFTKEKHLKYKNINKMAINSLMIK